MIQGDLQSLRASGGDFTTSLLACLEDNSLDASSSDTSVPPGPGAGYYYLVRTYGCGQAGTYDSGEPSQVGSRDAEIAASGLSCP